MFPPQFSYSCLIILYFCLFLIGTWQRIRIRVETNGNPDSLTNRPTNILSEEQKVALLGRPRLGENIRLQIRVKESKEFKVRIETFSFVFLDVQPVNECIARSAWSTAGRSKIVDTLASHSQKEAKPMPAKAKTKEKSQRVNKAEQQWIRRVELG